MMYNEEINATFEESFKLSNNVGPSPDDGGNRSSFEPLKLPLRSPLYLRMSYAHLDERTSEEGSVMKKGWATVEE